MGGWGRLTVLRCFPVDFGFWIQSTPVNHFLGAVRHPRTKKRVSPQKRQTIFSHVIESALGKLLAESKHNGNHGLIHDQSRSVVVDSL